MSKETFEITRESILEAAEKCSTAKATLKIMFPKAFIQEGVSGLIEKIKGYKSACEHMNFTPLTIDDFNHELPQDREAMFALHQINMVRRAFNGSRKIDYSNSSQKKWYIYLVYKAGVGLAYNDYACNCDYSSAGARLSFLDEEVIRHLSTQEWYIDLLRKYNTNA